MRFLLQCLFSTGLVILTVGWPGTDNPLLNGSLANVCGWGGAKLTEGRWLGLYCRNDEIEVYNYNYTWLDLDLCVGNYNGELIPYDNGNYTLSCGNCAADIQNKTVFLNCGCWNTAKEYTNSSIDLNGTVYAVNGSAGCFDHLGNKTWRAF